MASHSYISSIFIYPNCVQEVKERGIINLIQFNLIKELISPFWTYGF